MGGEEGLSVCKTRLLCISPEEELGLCFTIITFLAWLLFLCFCILSFLVPTFWNSVKARRLSRLFLKLRHGEHVGLLYLGSPHRVFLSFNPHRFLWYSSTLRGSGRLDRKEEPHLGPKSGLLSNTQKWIIQAATHADKVRDFIGKEHPGGEQEGEGTQDNCSATRLLVSAFMVMGLVSRLPPASYLAWFTVWLRVLPGGMHLSVKMDSNKKDSGRLAISSLFQPLPNSPV